MLLDVLKLMGRDVHITCQLLLILHFFYKSLYNKIVQFNPIEFKDGSLLFEVRMRLTCYVGG